MRFIKRQLKGDQRCAVTGRHTDERGFIHTRRRLSGWDPEVFVSAVAVEQMGRELGMVSQEEIADHLQTIDRLTARLAELEHRLGLVEKIEAAEAELEKA